MLDQMQVTTVIPSLSALLAHPEFQQGLADGRSERFLDSYEDAPLTEEEMIEEVEGNLSRRAIEREKKLCRMYGWEPSSYLYTLGCVIGIIDQGLTYTR